MYMNGVADQVVAKGITLVQTALKNAGFDPGPVDGILGPKTKAAIRAFQTAKGLTADGIVGPITSAALAPYLSTPKPDPSSISPTTIPPLKTDVGTPDIPVIDKQNTTSPAPSPQPSAPHPAPDTGKNSAASMALPLLGLAAVAALLMQ